MTEYTADDFKNARFAKHPDGRLASRTFPEDRWPWLVPIEADHDESTDQYTDRDMACQGFAPVQESPRPLTADDITDEMVERARVFIYDTWNDVLDSHEVRLILVSALTPHLVRPEGAEDIEALVEESLSGDALSDAQVRALADFLAVRGVRVTGGN